MKTEKKTGKRCQTALILLLLCGLTACANPLSRAVETALTNMNESTEETYDENIEIRELKLRKIEPDSRVLEAPSS